jgi:hypothetical protein
MVKRSHIIGFFAVGAILFIIAVVAVRKISGGDETFARVAKAIQQDGFLRARVGEPLSDVQRDDGPWEVFLGDGGRRHGYYSVEVRGSQSHGAFKIYWHESPKGEVEVDAVCKTAPFKMDELLWGKLPAM